MRRNLLVLISLFLLDRLIKNIIWFSLQSSTGGFLHPVLNINIAFSFQIPGFSSFFLTALLVCIVLGFVGVCIYYYRRQDPQLFWWALIAIGALSNLLDRFVLGGVLDYIDIGWFPIFNLSDTYITIGVLFLLYRELKKKSQPTFAK